MVMEPPTPQCVGREFVRQYYTMLHEAPQYLHRFYSQNSSFVHGGVEKPGEEQPPVMGQSAINDKVLSLNFQDCHAKIRQVDSQATVGNAVVIQVTGELSNNGQPMRRFMQTFILAPQSPKKYYVHNDIFRYQDEVFHDSDSEEEKEEEVICEVDCATVLTEDSDSKMLDTASQPDETPDIPIATFESVSSPLMSNGTSHLESPMESEAVPEEAPVVMIREDVHMPAPEETEEVEDLESENVKVEPEELKVEDEELGDEPLSVQEEAPKTFSWAAITSKSPSLGGQPTVPAVVSKPMALSKAAPTDIVKQDDGSSVTGPQPQRPPRSTRERSGAIRERGSQSGSIGRSENDMDEGRKMQQRWPDHHQLFVGNLPLDTTVDELRTYFESYGKVVEVRLNTKGTDKKNYCFIIFEQAKVVEEVLKTRKDLKRFRNNYHRLNVEEKKPKSEFLRTSSGPRSNMRGGSMGIGRGGSERNMRGGGMRGGMSRPDTRGGGRGGFGGPRR